MSTKFVGLASDLASFNNTDPAQALDALRSGLTGETEPLKQYGINLNDAALKQEALRLGLDASGPTLSASAKAQAAYSADHAAVHAGAGRLRPDLRGAREPDPHHEQPVRGPQEPTWAPSSSRSSPSARTSSPAWSSPGCCPSPSRSRTSAPGCRTFGANFTAAFSGNEAPIGKLLT
jgi:hypothetical protein